MCTLYLTPSSTLTMVLMLLTSASESHTNWYYGGTNVSVTNLTPYSWLPRLILAGLKLPVGPSFVFTPCHWSNR